MILSHLDCKPFTLKDFSVPDPVEPEFVPLHIPEVVVEEEIPPPEPVFNGEELEAARAEGYAQGKQDGKLEAEAAANLQEKQERQMIAALVSDLLARFDGEVAQQAALRAQERKEVGALVLLLARKLAGNALTAQPLGAVEPMIADCLSMLQGESRLFLSVAPELVAPLNAYLAQHPREGQAISVMPDPAMQAGDCRIQWQGGKAERNHEAIWREIETIVMRAMTPADTALKTDE